MTEAPAQAEAIEADHQTQQQLQAEDTPGLTPGQPNQASTAHTAKTAEESSEIKRPIEEHPENQTSSKGTAHIEHLLPASSPQISGTATALLQPSHPGQQPPAEAQPSQPHEPPTEPSVTEAPAQAEAIEADHQTQQQLQAEDTPGLTPGQPNQASTAHTAKTAKESTEKQLIEEHPENQTSSGGTAHIEHPLPASSPQISGTATALPQPSQPPAEAQPSQPHEPPTEPSVTEAPAQAEAIEANRQTQQQLQAEDTPGLTPGQPNQASTAHTAKTADESPEKQLIEEHPENLFFPWRVKRKTLQKMKTNLYTSEF